MGVERKAHPGDITRGDGGHKMGSRSGRGLVGCKLLVVTVKDCAKLTVLAAAVMVCVCVSGTMDHFPCSPGRATRMKPRLNSY